jgi:DNA polymerase-3 subunit gamma/tau
MRDAQSLLEQLLSFAPEHISLADVHEMLGTANDQLLFRLLDAMLHCEPVKIFAELDTAASEGVDFSVMVEQMMGLLRDLLVTASGGDASLLLFCSPPQFEQVKTTANAFGLHRILASLQILDHTYTKMRFSTQGRVLTELALVRIAHLDHFQMISVLLDRLRDGTLSVQLPTVPQPQLSAQTQTPPQSPTPTPTEPIPPSVKPVQRAIPAPQPASPKQSQQQHPTVVSQTPKERFAESFATQGVDLVTLTDEKATIVWKNAADKIPGMLATYASNCKKISFESPNLFVAVFDNGLAKEICEKESPQLQNALSQTIGQAVRIRFELVEKNQKTAPIQEVNRRELYKKASENPMVQKIREVFDAELSDLVPRGYNNQTPQG